MKPYPTTTFWANHGSVRSIPSPMPHIRKSATQSLGAMSVRSIATRNGEEMLGSRTEEKKQTQFLSVNQADKKGVEQPNLAPSNQTSQKGKHQDQAEGIRLEVSPEEGWKPEEDVELIPLDPDKLERKARISSGQNQEEKVELAPLL
ncbi:unnamed protein product [Prunus armeniaca]